MARDAAVEARLLRWAEWVTVGDGSGYATVSVLHEQWSPPTPGRRPSIKVSPGSAQVRDTHQAIGRLTARQRDTVVVHYVKRGGIAHQAAVLGCSEATLHARIATIHRCLMADPGWQRG
jgi:DNA-directed RNA polymerase specialized sigma24 family protein